MNRPTVENVIAAGFTLVEVTPVYLDVVTGRCSRRRTSRFMAVANTHPLSM